MELKNEFRVSVPIDVAWDVLTDLERIAPCMPGAELQEVEGDEYRGSVKVKVGPIVAHYKGKARFTEKNDEAHRAVLKAEGRDTPGSGQCVGHGHRHSDPRRRRDSCLHRHGSRYHRQGGSVRPQHNG